MSSVFLCFFIAYALLAFFVGLSKSTKGKAYQNAYIFELTGAFVMGDAVIFGLFWAIVTFIILLAKVYILFPVFYSVFWATRGLTESIYWLNQQFSTIKKETPEKFRHQKIFKNDSIWFVNQIFWQCVTVVSIVAALYFTSIWLKG